MIGIGLFWLAAAAVLGLVALVAAIVSVVLPFIIGTWAIAAALVGLQSARSASIRTHQRAAVAGALSAVAAGLLAGLTQGSGPLWIVTACCAAAGLLSTLLVWQAREGVGAPE